MTEPPGRAGNPEPGDERPDGPSQHWSPNQPPPSQWQVPGRPQAPGERPSGPHTGSGGPGGQGSPPGWGATAHRPGWVDAPKPGVIPLRPLRLGEIFDGAISTTRLYWRTTLGFTLVVAVVIQIAVGASGWFTQDKVNAFYDRFTALTESNPPPSLNAMVDLVRDALPTLLLNLGVLQLLSFLGMLVITSVITIVIGRAVIGAPMTPREAFAEARPRLLRLAGLTILVLLIPLGALAAGLVPFLVAILIGLSGGALSFLFVVFGLIGVCFAVHFAIRLTLAGPALMLEKQTIIRSISRALKLSKGSWWRIFGIQLLVGILTLIITSVIGLPFEAIGNAVFSPGSGSAADLGYYTATGIGGVIGMLLVYPFSSAVTALIYADQRIRRESLDLDLGRAAGLTLPAR